MSQTEQTQFTFSDKCQALLNEINLTEQEVLETYQKRDKVMIVPATPAHLYAIRWLEDGSLIFISCTFTRMEWHVNRARPAEILIQLALKLRPSLPAGLITRDLEMDQIWSLIAESFGTEVSITIYRTLGWPTTSFR